MFFSTQINLQMPTENQEMAGAGTPVAVHISAPEAPSEMITVGFSEAKMTGAGLTHPALVVQWS